MVRNVAGSTAAAAAAAEAATVPPGWTPSRFFGGWKKVAAKAAGFEAYWRTMGNYETPTPETRERIVDAILRTTIVEGYESGDFYEGVSHRTATMPPCRRTRPPL